jgi:hypothetical protein
MLIMNEDNPNSLFSMDIELGKIVEEWTIHDDVPVTHIAPESKFAQMTPQQTLIGASGNALYRIDPRVSGNKMVDSQFKQYTTKQKFSGITTTEQGRLAVGSEKGEIRLFDAIGKNAKTALPPLGDPIIGIDVTANGRYIVATTKTYLLLIDTLIGDGKYAGSFGFDRSFPANAKPVPKRLQLRGEHVAYMSNEVSFSPARCEDSDPVPLHRLTLYVDSTWARARRRMRSSPRQETMSLHGTLPRSRRASLTSTRSRSTSDHLESKHI